MQRAPRISVCACVSFKMFASSLSQPCRTDLPRSPQSIEAQGDRSQRQSHKPMYFSCKCRILCHWLRSCSRQAINETEALQLAVRLDLSKSFLSQQMLDCAGVAQTYLSAHDPSRQASGCRFPFLCLFLLFSLALALADCSEPSGVLALCLFLLFSLALAFADCSEPSGVLASSTLIPSFLSPPVSSPLSSPLSVRHPWRSLSRRRRSSNPRRCRRRR